MKTNATRTILLKILFFLLLSLYFLTVFGQSNGILSKNSLPITITTGIFSDSRQALPLMNFNNPLVLYSGGLYTQKSNSLVESETTFDINQHTRTLLLFNSICCTPFFDRKRVADF